MPKLLSTLSDKFLKKVYKCGYKRLKPEKAAEYLGISLRTYFRYKSRFSSFRQAMESGAADRRDDDFKQGCREIGISEQTINEMDSLSLDDDFEIKPKAGFIIETERVEHEDGSYTLITRQYSEPLPTFTQIKRALLGKPGWKIG